MEIIQAQKAPFYLYAYCLMPNHIQLLVERKMEEALAANSALSTTW